MLKFFFCASIMLFCVINTTFSQVKTRLVVFSHNSERFWLLVNGKKINEQAEARVVAEDITGEAWQITATFENQSIPDIIYQGFRIGNSKEQTYIIKKKRGKYRIKTYGVPQRLFSEIFKSGRLPIRIDR